MTTIAEVSELVPARMLSEYAYCPRLFFLEWVDRLWAPSSDTAEGGRQHRRVDAGGGAAPLPDEGFGEGRAVGRAVQRAAGGYRGAGPARGGRRRPGASPSGAGTARAGIA